MATEAGARPGTGAELGLKLLSLCLLCFPGASGRKGPELWRPPSLSLHRALTRLALPNEALASGCPAAGGGVEGLRAVGRGFSAVSSFMRIST